MERAVHDPSSSPRIRRLDEAVKNQIAAGEVIERPASVVKELVENALDAGASELVVDLEDGGVRLVRVVDDGAGMSTADLELAFVAHATSKLHSVADLDHIASLGFRGEALASVASVARCRIVSRERDSPEASSIECEGGALGAVRAAAGASGTLVEVRDLFFNVPARRRFLKTTATEFTRILDVLQRVALAHEHIGLRLTHDGARALDVERGLDARGRIRRVFGADFADALASVDAQKGTTRIRGFVAPPRFARHDSSRQMWFVNGRAVRDKVLLRALKEAYRGFVFDARQPCAVLHLDIDPGLVDVNVHPQKSEVRFRDERALVGFLIASLRDVVRASDMATPGTALLESAARRATAASSFDFGPAVDPRPSAEPMRVYEVTARASVSSSASLSAHSVVHESVAPSPARRESPSSGAILQIARTYLVRALEEGFEIADQHALHERITFEALLAESRRGGLEVQHLAFPELVDVSRAELELLMSRAADIARAGVEIEAFGATTLAIRGLPARLERPRPPAIVRDLVLLLEESGVLSAERLCEEVLHRAACRSSVMAGDPLTQDEMRTLFARGAALESDQTCVHGRPTRVRFALADLEKAFGRR